MRLLIAALLCAAAFGASAQMYRWTDDKGRVHFSSTPPPAGAKGVQKKALAAPAAPAAPPAESESYALARKNFPVTLYTAPGCEPCEDARKLLNARGIPFKEVSVVEDPQIEELRKVADADSVPVLIVGSSVRKGFAQSTYHGTLDAAGYPKTGVLPPRYP